ncbi:hypothetical protein OUZ56_010574 [Daphnia magna]|uniref:Uncharacterized protein n=1 Tax=Daphnia magna TaxID=35525 RepID=A0ABR0AIY5_9CRUS|nr:hypothetical protein OUZ56_010574 [Daphnia magna]
MGEAVKLGHLWSGLKPSVLKNLWSLKPGTCEEFLQEVKRYQETAGRMSGPWEYLAKKLGNNSRRN